MEGRATSLRDMTLDVWESLFDLLLPRHLVRLMRTGDKLVEYAIKHAWRRCNLSYYTSHVPCIALESTFIKSVLVGRARELSLGIMNFAKLDLPLSLLQSLEITESQLARVSFGSDGVTVTRHADEWFQFMSKQHCLLDFSELTPNLKSLELDVVRLEYPIGLTSGLESLAIDATDGEDSGYTPLTIFKDGLSSLPSTLSSLSFTVWQRDVPLLSSLPSSITCLHLFNRSCQLDTSMFSHLSSLAELRIQTPRHGGLDYFQAPTDNATMLGILPPSLTSIHIDTLTSATDWKLALSVLPPAVTSISFLRLLPAPSADDLVEVLKLLSTRTSLADVDRISSFVSRHYRRQMTPGDGLWHQPLANVIMSTLRSKGVNEPEYHVKMLAYRDVAHHGLSGPQSVADAIAAGLKEEDVGRFFPAGCLQFDHLVLCNLTDDARYDELMTVAKHGLVRHLCLSGKTCRRLPDGAAAQIVELNVSGIGCASVLGEVLSSTFSRLETLVVGRGSFPNWLSVASTICEHAVNMPLLETIRLDDASGTSDLHVALICDMFAKIRFYIKEGGTLSFRFHVEEPSGNTTLAHKHLLLK